MNKLIVWTVFLASASLLAEAPKSLNEQEAVSLNVESAASTEQLQSEKEALVIEALKSPAPEALQVEAVSAPDQAPSTIAMEEPSVLQVVQAAVESSEAVPDTAQMSSVEAAPVLQIEATQPAEVMSAEIAPAPIKMDSPQSQPDPMSKKKEEKLGTSRFANIAIGATSAAVVIVAAILGSN